ncbi:MAG: AAA family ATPase [Ruminococcus sp.]|nr:AAA family ATPase [Ruminococcus sp.]
MIYLNLFKLPGEDMEWRFLVYGEKRTCFNTYYPFQIFPKMDFEEIEFEPVTIFYGGNGTGKTTLLNIIAEKLKVTRNSVFNRSNFFDIYVSKCRADLLKRIPTESRIITSDDVFDYMIDVRNLNDGIHNKREELFEEYIENKKSNFKFRTMEDYEKLKKVNETRRKSQSKYIDNNLIKNVREYSNGESAYKFFTEKIKQNSLYLLDEPENSLSAKRQLELTKYIEEAARFYKCQFIISTHSPFLLALPFAKIYNLDVVPVNVSKWTELENVRIYYDFIMSHKDEF